MSGTLSFIRRFAPWILIAVGAVLAILGILTRTAWAPDPLWTATVKPSADTRLVISDPGMLNLMADEVTIEATVVDGEDLAAEPEDPDVEPSDEDPAADEEDADAEDAEAETDAAAEEEPGVVISIARDVDAEGWIGDAAALRVTGLQTESTLRTTAIDGELEAAAAPDSDLWWYTAEGPDSAELVWTKEPGRWSVVIASSADKKISEVSFTWPQSTATPLATPLILVGAFLILAGAALLLFPQLLDKGARDQLVTSLREKSRARGPQVSETAEEEPASETAPEEEPAPAVEPAEDDTVVAPVSVAEPSEQPVTEETSSEIAVPEPVAGPEPEPAARFTPGTMTRRQIRELERARQEASRRANEGARPEALLAEMAAGNVVESDSPDAVAADAADAEDTTPVRRSEQWRKTWGFMPEEDPDERTTAWLPESVSDEEDNRDA